MKKIIIFVVTILTLALSGCYGDSAYDLAVKNGFNGSIQDYLESLKGEDAANITIQDIFNSLVELGEYEEDEYSQFLNDYLNDYLKEANDEEVVRNNTLKSAVSITVSFSGSSSTYSGSGVVYKIEDNAAYIITNHHVVYESNTLAKNIYVYLYGMEYDQYKYTALYVGASAENDVAVIKITLDDNSTYLEEAKISGDNRIYAGDDVFVLGNALGYGMSITSGIVSVESEYISTSNYSNVRVFRLDASVNGGNSGGGAFNKYGELIGIVDAKIISEEVEGVGYAIPISTAKVIADNIIRNNSDVKRVILGIVSVVSSSSLHYDNDMQKFYITERIEIDSVNLYTTADSIGLKKGDELVSATFKGVTHNIERSFTLSELLYTADAGDTLEITVYRNGQFMSFSMTLSY